MDMRWSPSPNKTSDTLDLPSPLMSERYNSSSKMTTNKLKVNELLLYNDDEVRFNPWTKFSLLKWYNKWLKKKRQGTNLHNKKCYRF